MSKQNGFICIVDYNLSRIADVRLMTRYARERYGLGTLLIRANPTVIDRELADVVLNIDPLSPAFIAEALNLLEPFRAELKAVLPFSDNSVVTGARLAEQLGLRGDSSALATRAFSKRIYREAEKSAAAPCGTMIPRSANIETLEGLELFVESCGEAILKPSCEGNNRGVLRLKKGDSLAQALSEVSKYIDGGLIAEEVIPFAEEYSFDGIGPLEFVTEKLCAHGRYPVECGQIVPALLSTEERKSIAMAGRFANAIVGQKVGPFHNEIKFDPQSLRTGVIEPNRRPAGMLIWHLAERAFGVNFFEAWIDQLVTGQIPCAVPAPIRRAGVRMLPAPFDGIMSFPVDSARETQALISRVAERFLRERITNTPVRTFDFRWLVAEGAPITEVPADNSGFIAQICMEVDDPSHDLAADLHSFAEAWIRELGSELQQSTVGALA